MKTKPNKTAFDCSGSAERQRERERERERREVLQRGDVTQRDSCNYLRQTSQEGRREALARNQPVEGGGVVGNWSVRSPVAQKTPLVI